MVIFLIEKICHHTSKWRNIVPWSSGISERDLASTIWITKNPWRGIFSIFMTSRVSTILMGFTCFDHLLYIVLFKLRFPLYGFVLSKIRLSLHGSPILFLFLSYLLAWTCANILHNHSLYPFFRSDCNILGVNWRFLAMFPFLGMTLEINVFL